MSPTPSTPIELFYCYSHADKKLRDELQKGLRGLQRDKLISNWYDRDIDAGDEWRTKIDAHLNAAQIILLLISPDFIDSDYCWDIEMKRAMERHKKGTARVIPVILRPCNWKRVAPFEYLQVLPTDAKPITSWDNQDAAFLDVAEGIERVIRKMIENP